MTPSNPYLLLKRLLITTHTGASAYDETFHVGVNIIRGDNSAGKSTISNFIFYALGGDYSNWNSESLKCREVYAEVEINGAVYTLRRQISSSARQPMSIYWGVLDEAKGNAVTWKTFPYQQTENKISFTNVIFNALNYPEVKTDSDSTITFHQILRLLYIDQDTPTQGLFRRELFDQPLIRQAISELLLGIYDDKLYNYRIELRKSIKEHDEKKREYDGLLRLYSKSGLALNIDELNKVTEKVRQELNNVQSQITSTKEARYIRIAINSQSRVEKTQKELIPVKQKLKDITNNIYELDLDITDSKNFIETLQKRIDALNSSILTRIVLGEISLDVCPQCFNPLDNHVGEGHCFLCKQPLTDSEEITHAKRLKQELELQIKESNSLLTKKEKTLTDLRSNLPIWKQKTVTLQRELDLAINESQSTRDNLLDDLLIRKGGIEKQLEILMQQVNGVSLLEQLKKEITELSSIIERLNLTIQQLEINQRNNKDLALATINKIAVHLLRTDLPRQNEFKTAKSVDIDFYGDAFSLDGNFNFSASSNTYLKNSIRFALFFASLRIDFMRLPKFILCDNMEDKGMQKERTQHFQELITKLSDGFLKENKAHQIIFSTSMISDKLEGTKYCIGNYYKINQKTLKT